MLDWVRNVPLNVDATVLNIETEISPCQEVKMESFYPTIFISSLGQLIV